MVRPEETFERLLGVGESWRVIRAEYEQETETFVICVEETEIRNLLAMLYFVAGKLRVPCW